MADTIFMIYRGSGLLVKDFGSEYPIVLAALQKTTREEGDKLRDTEVERVRLATDRMDSSNRGEQPLVRVIGASEQRVELT